jgi:hypothetical protein
MSKIFSSVDSCVITSFCDGFAGSFMAGLIYHRVAKKGVTSKDNILSEFGDAILRGTVVSTLSCLWSTIKGEKMNITSNVIFWLTCIIFGTSIHLTGETVSGNTE